MYHTFRRCLIVGTLVVTLLACSSGSKNAASSVTTATVRTTATSKATTTSSEAPTTTTIDTSNLQNLVIAPPPGYSFASSLGDTNNPNASFSSGDIASSDFNNGLGIPTAADTLHFQQGYGQVYHYDASPANSTQRALEVDLFKFDGPSDATAFVQQAADRLVSQGNRATKTATTVSGAAAVSVNSAGKTSDGIYEHALLATRDNLAMELLFGDLTEGPPPFLATIGPQQYAKL